LFVARPGGPSRSADRLAAVLQLSVRLLSAELPASAGELRPPVLPLSGAEADPGLQQGLAQLLPPRTALPQRPPLHPRRVLKRASEAIQKDSTPDAPGIRGAFVRYVV